MKSKIQLLYGIFTVFTFLWTQQLHAQQNQHIISGIIYSEEGNGPVPGVLISIKNTDVQTLTDANGRFEIRSTIEFPIYVVISHTDYAEEELELLNSEQQLQIRLVPLQAESTDLNELVISSRRRTETAQKVPIPIAVIGSAQIEQTGTFNVNRVKELVPSVQLYSSNPRNTTLNIRGMGSAFGLTNDGIEPGVGFYIDGVYFARPAATTLDFIDIERIEVLRGPQGTLFGKNTTAGTFNIVTKKPGFSPSAVAEISYGNLGYLQAKASINGGLSERLAGRLSFSGTQRNGTIENVRTGKYLNDLNNIGIKGQLLFNVNENAELLVSVDYSRQRPDGYAQVVAGVVKTQRADYRQFNEIIADLGYHLPSSNAFDRKVDQDTPWRSDNDLGGISVHYEHAIGNGTLTSVSAWRFWDWNPSNDRDFTGLPVLTKSQAPSKHNQWSQEIRYAGNFSKKVSGILGFFMIGQDLKSSPYHIEESGTAQWRFAQNSTSSLWSTPELLNGYGIRTRSGLRSFSTALFGQVDWAVTPKFHILPGIRYNYDEKKGDYVRTTYGGLETQDPDLLAIKKSVYSDQQFKTSVSDANLSGQLTLQYTPSDKINTFITFAKSFKPVGLNLGGLPTSNGQPLTELAVVKPEEVTHYEAGFKSTPTVGSRFNFTFYRTVINDFQTQVQSAELGVNRGYLANAEKVSIQGVEVEGAVPLTPSFFLTGSFSYTYGKYNMFKNAPVPLEESGAEKSFKDISGSRLPGVSKWSGALGLEYSKDAVFMEQKGTFFFALDGFFRSGFSSSSSPSHYLNIAGYVLLNARTGFRINKGLSAFIWGRNVLNRDYYELLLPAAGNAGQFAAVLGDPATYGITLKYVLN